MNNLIIRQNHKKKGCPYIMNTPSKITVSYILTQDLTNN